MPNLETENGLETTSEEEEETQTNSEETSQEEQETNQPQSLEEARKELDRLNKQLKKVNQESAQRRIELKALKDAQKEFEQAEMSDLEKTRDDLKELQQENTRLAERLRTHDLRRAFEWAAEKLEVQFSNQQAVDDAFNLAQPLLVDIEINDAGQVPVKDMRAVVKEVLDGRDYLITTKPVKSDIDAGKRGTASQTTPDEEVEREKRKDIDYTSL